MTHVPRWPLYWCVTATIWLASVAYAFAAEKPGMIALATVVCIGSVVLLRMGAPTEPAGPVRRIVPRWVLNALVLAAIVHLAARFIFALDDDAVITRLADFLTIVLLIKAFDRVRVGDEAQLLGLACFVTIGAMLTGQSLALGAALIGLTPLAIISAVLLQVHGGRERAEQRARMASDTTFPATLGQAWSARATGRRAAMLGLACALAGSVLAVVVFIVAPRNITQQMVAGSLGQVPPSTGNQVGFRENIRLGQSGLINESDEIALEMIVRDGLGEQITALSSPIYLRGSVLTVYDPVRREWSSGPEAPTFETREVEGSGTMRVGDGQSSRSLRTVEITQRTGVNGPSGVPLFAPLRPTIIRGPVAANGPSRVRFAPVSSLVHCLDWRGGRMAYSITWQPDYREPSPIRWIAPSSAVFPPSVIATARQIMRDNGIDPATISESTEPATLRQVASAISSHLRQGFMYSLEQASPPDGVDPLDYFLTTSRTGHCEYFASAMVGMLQCLGVPARVVTGYAAAEVNDISGHFVVRQSDAHAWVEVRLAPDRWETFDPTPPAQLQSSRRASRSLWARAKQAWEAVEFSWLDNIVAYESGLKWDVLAGVQARGDTLIRFQQSVDRANKSIRSWLPNGSALGAAVVIGVFFALIALLVLAVRYGAKWLSRLVAALLGVIGRRVPAWLLRRGGTGPVVTSQTRFYADLLSTLRSAGLEKPDAATPLAYANDRVAATDAAAGDGSARVVQQYYAARFGGVTLSPAEQADARSEVARVRERLAAARARQGEAGSAAASK